MSLNVPRTRELLQNFDFPRLFIEELGWSNPASRQPVNSQISTKNYQLAYTRTPIAQLAGVMVLEIKSGDGIPDAKARAAIQKQVSEQHLENLLIFLDSARSQSLWYWVKREGNKSHPRDHLYVKGQPGNLFLGKLAGMVVDISELDAEGNIPVLEVANRLKAALDVEHVTKKFYAEFDAQRLSFIEHIQGIDDEHQRRWYASVLMNRLMFIYFLQKKLFLDRGNEHYLEDKLAQSRKRRPDTFYSVFLKALFFEGFAKPEPARSPEARALLGRIRYLNGGLFLPHRVELNHGFPGKPGIKIPNVAFENVFTLFGRYSWNLNDTPGGKDDEINPDVLGYIFEKYINQKEFGAHYTRPEITGHLSERTIFKLVLDRLNALLKERGLPESRRRFATISDLLLNLDATLCSALLFEVLPSLRLLDPACGSAAFLVAAMKVLINLYSAVNQTTAGTEALVFEDGTCILQQSVFLKVLKTYTTKLNIIIEAGGTSLKFFSTTLPITDFSRTAIPPGKFQVFPVTDLTVLRPQGAPPPPSLAPASPPPPEPEPPPAVFHRPGTFPIAEDGKSQPYTSVCQPCCVLERLRQQSSLARAFSATAACLVDDEGCVQVQGPGREPAGGVAERED